MNYDKLIQNINPPDSTAPFRLWDEVGYIVPWQDIKNIVKNGSDVNFDTIGTAFMVRDRRRNPFKGTNIDYVEGEHGSATFKETVVFPALTNSVKNATIANALANCGRFVLILKNYDYQADGKGKYQVFGIDGGLKLEGEPFDPYADAAWNITLTSERVAQSAVYLWTTDEATTDAKWSLITQYEYITGLSLASGTVTPQVVFLAVDSDKSCKVILPDGSILTSTEGTIDTTWTGAAGAVTLIKNKDTSVFDMTNSDYIGNLITTQSDLLQTTDCASLTSISAPNVIDIYAGGCTSLTSLSAPNATYIDAFGCDLTAVAIAALLAELVATGNEDGTLDISGGSTADYGIWSAQAQADAATLDSRGWTLTYNT